ncbi:MAG: hypothetical protein HFI91_07140 [Lachnospiraceae bacterium]|jgi:uncharacterized ubiquitin-like protein YukD|nr:hypothetical protein [Lachnospiraceae bacterium]
MEYALVTVRAEKMHWQADMELPARMKIRELAVQILETLKLHDEERFYHVSEISLFYQDKKLHMDASLADYMIWDGSILDIRY